MFCKYCGAQNPDGAPFCSRCGYKTQQPDPAYPDGLDRPVMNAPASPAVSEPQPEGKSYLKWLIPLLCSAAAIGMVVLIASLSDGSAPAPPPQQNLQTVTVSASSAVSTTTSAATTLQTTASATSAVTTTLTPMTQVTAPPASATTVQTFTAVPPAPVTQTTTTAPPPKDWGEQYAEYLRHDLSSSNITYYMLMYIDGDDIPEMVFEENGFNGNEYLNTTTICTIYNGQLYATKITDGAGLFGFASGKKNLFTLWDEYTEVNGVYIYAYHLDRGRPVRDAIYHEGYSTDSYSVNGRSMSRDDYLEIYDDTVSESVAWGIGLVGDPSRYCLGSYPIEESDIVRVLEKKDFYNPPPQMY